MYLFIYFFSLQGSRICPSGKYPRGKAVQSRKPERPNKAAIAISALPCLENQRDQGLEPINRFRLSDQMGTSLAFWNHGVYSDLRKQPVQFGDFVHGKQYVPSVEV